MDDSGDRAWSARRSGVAALINDKQPQFVCMQECESDQRSYLTSNCAGYAAIYDNNSLSWIEENVQKADKFDYSNIDSLSRFTETHPKVMLDRIARLNWKFDYDLSCNRTSFKDRVKSFFEKLGLHVGQYRNYVIVK